MRRITAEVVEPQRSRSRLQHFTGESLFYRQLGRDNSAGSRPSTAEGDYLESGSAPPPTTAFKWDHRRFPKVRHTGENERRCHFLELAPVFLAAGSPRAADRCGDSWGSSSRSGFARIAGEGGDGSSRTAGTADHDHRGLGHHRRVVVPASTGPQRGRQRRRTRPVCTDLSTLLERRHPADLA